MLSNCYFYRIFVVVVIALVRVINSMSMINKHSYFMDSSNANNDVVDLIISKGYIPNEKYLPKNPLVKSTDNEVTYLLSKLSDEELIKLLNEPRKNGYDLNDIVKLALDSKFSQDKKLRPDAGESNPHNIYADYENQNSLNKKRFRTVSENDKSQVAVFRLENKHVDPYSVKTDADPNYLAVQKLSNMLYSRPLQMDRDENEEDEQKKELLFDVLVSQLKTLCCNNRKGSKKSNLKKNQPLNEIQPYNLVQNSQNRKIVTHEHMFLIINDEIKNNGSDELISVDPDSLERNSSVLLLGPITTPLSESQLKLVMYRISNELSKPEYLPLLQQLSVGTLNGNNIKLMKSLITGPETRRAKLAILAAVGDANDGHNVTRHRR